MVSSAPATGGDAPQPTSIPVLLLKTQATPHDGYADWFSAADAQAQPTFVPVLEHTFFEEPLSSVRDLLRRQSFGRTPAHRYGGLIFTSQRAVEAFAQLVGETPGEPGWPHLHDVPIYTVGPATTRALRAVPQQPPLQIFGEDTGNGEALAHYMLDHYGAWHAARTRKPPLLFLVGDQRRDVIPKTLMDAALVPERYIPVEEVVVYGTTEMGSFAADFAMVLAQTRDAPTRWVVVFSPTGCDAMLRGLDMLDAATGRVKTGERGGGCGARRGQRQTYIATIGPTTRDYLRRTFGFEADVCAARPSPEGVGSAIRAFMDGLQDAR